MASENQEIASPKPTRPDRPGRNIRIQVDREHTGKSKRENFFVPARLVLERGKVSKEIDPNGESFIEFKSRRAMEKAVSEAGFTPVFTDIPE